MGNFRSLRVWKMAKDLAVKVYKISDANHKLKNDYRLKSQICAAAVSIASNIAEGDESGTNKMSIRYFYIAKASTAELITQLLIIEEIGFVPKSEIDELVSTCEHISNILRKLIIARNK